MKNEEYLFDKAIDNRPYIFYILHDIFKHMNNLIFFHDDRYEISSENRNFLVDAPFISGFVFEHIAFFWKS